MAIDVHVHCKGGEEGEKILKLLSDFVVEDIEQLMHDKHVNTHRGLYGRER